MRKSLLAAAPVAMLITAAIATPLIVIVALKSPRLSRYSAVRMGQKRVAEANLCHCPIRWIHGAGKDLQRRAVGRHCIGEQCRPRCALSTPSLISECEAEANLCLHPVLRMCRPRPNRLVSSAELNGACEPGPAHAKAIIVEASGCCMPYGRRLLRREGQQQPRRRLELRRKRVDAGNAVMDMRHWSSARGH